MNIDLIETLRKRKGYSQKELAALIDYTDTGYQKIIKSGDIKASTLEKIAKVYGVDIAIFFKEEPTLVNDPATKYNKKGQDCEEIKAQMEFYKNLYEVTQSNCVALSKAVDALTNKKVKTKV